MASTTSSLLMMRFEPNPREKRMLIEASGLTDGVSPWRWALRKLANCSSSNRRISRLPLFCLSSVKLNWYWSSFTRNTWRLEILHKRRVANPDHVQLTGEICPLTSPKSGIELPWFLQLKVKTVMYPTWFAITSSSGKEDFVVKVVKWLSWIFLPSVVYVFDFTVQEAFEKATKQLRATQIITLEFILIYILRDESNLLELRRMCWQMWRRFASLVLSRPLSASMNNFPSSSSSSSNVYGLFMKFLKAD